MGKREQVLSKEIALLYLQNEFADAPIRVTTILDNDRCWTGKVLLEMADENEEIQDFEYLKAIYGRQK